MLKMYDEQIHSSRTAAGGMTSWMPLTVSAGPWQKPYTNIQDGMWMFSAELMYTNSSKVKAAREYMLSMAAVDSASGTDKRNAMFAMAKTAYYEWVLLKRKSMILERTDSLLSTIVELSKTRYKFNQDKLNNVYRAQAELFENRNMQTMTSGEMRMKNLELNTLMLIDRQIQYDVDTSLPNTAKVYPILDSESLSLSRSELRRIDATLNSLKMKRELALAKGLPDFGFSFSHMQAPAMMPNQFSAMVMMTLPFLPWSSSEYTSAAESVESELRAAEYERQSRLREIQGKVQMLQIQRETIQQQLSNYRQALLPTYRSSYESALLSYEQNGESLNVVLDALRMYRMAQMSELDSCSALVHLQVEIEKELEIR